MRKGKGKRKRTKPPGSTSPLGAALQLLSNQLLNSIHCRDGTKKWLFIRILVWYCSVPHKRRFIMLGWGEKPLSFFFLSFSFFFLFSPDRNNNLKLSLKSFLSIINFIFFSVSRSASLPLSRAVCMCVRARVCVRGREREE